MLKRLALILAFSTSCANASEHSPENDLHTFFTSKQTRAQLNQMRNAGKFDTQQDASGKALSREPATVKMQGVVIREGKKPVVFLNNENTIKTRHLSNDVTVRDQRVNEENYKIPVRINDKGLTLKPGQQWSETTKQVKDTYQIKPENNRPEGLVDKSQSEILK